MISNIKILSLLWGYYRKILWIEYHKKWERYFIWDSFKTCKRSQVQSSEVQGCFFVDLAHKHPETQLSLCIVDPLPRLNILKSFYFMPSPVRDYEFSLGFSFVLRTANLWTLNRWTRERLPVQFWRIIIGFLVCSWQVRWYKAIFCELKELVKEA